MKKKDLFLFKKSDKEKEYMMQHRMSMSNNWFSVNMVKKKQVCIFKIFMTQQKGTCLNMQNVYNNQCHNDTTMHL